jgi:hypothetical protein
MEEGKRLAVTQATGDYLVFVDADNEFTHPDYVERAVRALAAHPQALGVESYYPPSPKMSSFCAYLTHLLHISDPVSWLMSAKPVLVGRDGEVERWRLRGDSLAYPLGANGFVFRKADPDAVHSSRQLFQDTHVALALMQMGKREWLRIRGRGVHHYYIQDLWSFLKKRRRAAAHYFNVRAQSQTSWAAKPAVPAWLAALYCATLVGPVYPGTHLRRPGLHDRGRARHLRSDGGQRRYDPRHIHRSVSQRVRLPRHFYGGRRYRSF